ncbi:MAG: hypothetical protein B6I20_04405 [Bacteroidetes bacterium 4572_117]|nr:MAG: hypothetical protein B6I20_04405 [Bacteroidetes bacterium 4572_117]
MKKTIIFIISIIFIIASTGLLMTGFMKKDAQKNTKTGNSKIHVPQIPFDLTKPVKKIKLPYELTEISALSHYGPKRIACIHDEKADIFMVDYNTEKIHEKFTLARQGDYEGVEIVDNTAYLLKSNGLLVKIIDFTKNSRIITKHKTGLTSKNDCEGLGFDKKSNKLLIVCKNSPNMVNSTIKYKNKRAVYEYDIIKDELNKQAKFLLNLKEIEKKTGKKKFMPSGIAVHPITNNIYITASVGNLLIILNPKGSIIDFAILDSKTFRQPEGICFSPDGKKLFISNEGKSKKGNILIFNHL